MAFIRGNCYYKLGSYEKAYVELQFAVKWGCDTKYALMAKDILEIIPGKEQYEVKSDRKLKSLKYKGIGKVILLAVDCFIIVLLGVVYNDCSYGSSMEEAYRKRYLCAENEPIVLYSEKIDDYELAILEEGEKTVYGLFSKPADSDYRVEKFLFVYNHTGEDPMEKYELELTESQKEVLQKNWLEGEVQGVINEFYKDNDLFQCKDMECIGISYSPLIENIVVNGRPLHIEQMIGADGQIRYMWKIKLDLEKDIIVLLNYS